MGYSSGTQVWGLIPFLGILLNIGLSEVLRLEHRPPSEWVRQGQLPMACFAFWLADSLWALTNRRRRTLRDLLAGTWVLEDRPCA